MTRVFALDPGPMKTGWVILELGRVVDSGVHPNDDVLRWVYAGQHAHCFVCEDMVAMGMPAGDEVLRTAKWLGRFAEAWDSRHGYRAGEMTAFVPRREVKSFLCGTQRAKDPNVRRALLDLFPQIGGGAEPAVGTKGQPGPLYGISSHAWSALAVAVTYCATKRVAGALPETRQMEIAA